MINGLKIFNLPKEAHLDLCLGGDIFVLKTCQRTLIVGHQLDHLIPSLAPLSLDWAQGKEAYRFLLETIVGLKSQILAENEITGQFKEAYRSYLGQEQRSTKLMQVLEKLFKDAKQIRSQYLNEVGQQSYAGIAKKILSSTLREPGLVTVLGSGQLARDIIKLLYKRHSLQVCARNPQRVQEVVESYPKLMTHPWEDYHHLWQAPILINTIGADETLFDEDFFKTWMTSHRHGRLFIDLSSPTVIQTSLTRDHGVIRLEDIFAHGVILNQEKGQKVQSAREAIGQLVDHRHRTLHHLSIAGQGEMSFA